MEDKEYCSCHPADNYYFKLDDLSINLILSLKWSLYAYFFFKSISKNIVNIETEYYLPTSVNSIAEKINHKIFLDDSLVNETEDFLSTLKKEYEDDFFNENTQIRLKLNLDLKSFLLLQNTHIPALFFKMLG